MTHAANLPLRAGPLPCPPMTGAARLSSIFSTLRAAGGKGLMPFVCGGYPGAGDTPKVLGAMARAGACVVEVGVPFSDPIADGPVIAAAMHEALARGATPAGVLDGVRAYRAAEGALRAGPGPRLELGLGLVAMISMSLVHRLGPAKFIADAKAAGLDGFIFPDVPLEESGEVIARTRDAGMTASLLIAPTTPAARAEKIAKACSGFVYLLARAGITGEGKDVPDVGPRVKMLRGVTDLPIACGFGISTASHVRQVVHEGGADAAIVGSALIRRMSDSAARGEDVVQAAEAFVRDLARGLLA